MKRRSPTRRAPSTPRATARSEYSFRQRFRVPAEWAFRWCIDYTPNDMATPPINGSREVRWRSDRTVELHDTFPAPRGARIRKVKLVQVYPDERHWVSTHIEGPNLHSQFRYTILPTGPNASVLQYRGRDLGWSGRPLSPKENVRRTKRLRNEDAAEWRRLAAAMENDYRAR